jgi:hypothetical protein
MVLPDRIELSTSSLPMKCSTTELRQRAGPEIIRLVRHVKSAGPMRLDAGAPSPNLLPMTDTKALQRGRREARRGAELRENLKRRKAQARARVDSDRDDADLGSPNSAGIAADKQVQKTG